MKKIKVAIIDDEPEYLNDMSKGLEILGYEVFKALTGSEAIEVIDKNKPDVVLCDYKLGDMDGTQVIARTKALNPSIVYIMVTAYYDETYSGIFKKAGADDTIYKPIQLLDVDKVIKKALSAKRGAA